MPKQMISGCVKDAGFPCRAGVLINPLGGRNRSCCTRLLSTAARLFDLVRQVYGPRDIESALRDFAGRGIDFIIISGGDGTIQAALTVLFRERPFASPPFLAVLPGGTTNLIAGDVGIPGNQEKAMKRLYGFLENQDLSHEGIKMKCVKRPVMRLGIPGARDEYGMFLGAAGIERAVRFFQEHIRKRKLSGRTAVFASAMHFFWNHLKSSLKQAPGIETAVKINGKLLAQRDFSLILATTLERLFWGLNPFVHDNDGCLHFLALPPRARSLWLALFSLLMKRGSDRFRRDNGYYSVNADRIEIYTKRAALDGQIFMAQGQGQPLTLDCGGNISFVVL